MPKQSVTCVHNFYYAQILPIDLMHCKNNIISKVNIGGTFNFEKQARIYPYLEVEFVLSCYTAFSSQCSMLFILIIQNFQ